ncbi:hypothetical protein LWI28_022738 [Acer negundo]|uniref:Uncharacterized protein n=1 Tax=Acer negundo TaxID=4023 RepID=A0AAD5IW45_ACENE|nr:hypothetical protein LWI28_022738 [Acer negundo]
MDDDNSRERLEENDIEIEEGEYNERKTSSRLFERFGSETPDYDKEFGSVIKEPLYGRTGPTQPPRLPLLVPMSALSNPLIMRLLRMSFLSKTGDHGTGFRYSNIFSSNGHLHSLSD